MNYFDAYMIAEKLWDEVAPACERGPLHKAGGEILEDMEICTIAGSLRRESAEVHDIEIVAKPRLNTPRAVFGDKAIYKTEFDKVLARLVDEGYIRFLMGGE